MKKSENESKKKKAKDKHFNLKHNKSELYM